MARIYYRCEPFSKADVTLALESGVDGVIVPRAQVEKVAALSRCTVWACEDVASVPLNVKADEEALVARLKAGETACLARGWEIIPVENLLAQADNVLAEAIEAGVKMVVCLSTDKAAYPINAMGISKAMMEKVIGARARTVSAQDTTICCTRYGNVMASRGSVIPLFIDQIKAGKPITITDPEMTRFLMSLDEAVDLVAFAFGHANPGDLFVQKSPASTIGDLAKAVQKLFGDTGTHIIGTRHGEKLYETLLTREEKTRSEDLGGYYRVAADGRDLNYDKYFVNGEVRTQAPEDYTSHNTRRLTVDEVVDKLLSLEYVKEELAALGK